MQSEEEKNAKVARWQEKLINLKSDYEKLLKNFEVNYPKYHQLKYSKQNIEVDLIQSYLKEEDNTLVEYFINDNIAYAFVISSDSFQVRRLAHPSTFVQLIQAMNQAIKNRETEAYYKNAHLIYQKIFAPIADLIQTERVIIIPDGPLWYLNFDVLLTQQTDNTDFRNFAYFIQKYAVSYAYSIKLLLQEKPAPTKEAINNQCLAFSYSNQEATNEGQQITMRAMRRNIGVDLPGSRKEIGAVSKILDGEYYYGYFANESNFKKHANKFNILHLALHGEVNEKIPLQSRLHFTQSQNQDNTEDNYLHAYELYNMELNAELAVLSACNTGTGKLVKGEGLMSLGRAFTYAGCKSILISHWELADETTSELVESFYKNIKKGMSKDQALRQSKLLYLSKTNNVMLAHPFYWAPLTQIGDNSKINIKGNQWRLWFLLGVCAVLVSVIVKVTLKKRGKG